jgi:uncharacterized protein (DUF983 family)
MKGPSFSNLMDSITHRTKIQYFCPNCSHGPFFTAHNNTNCPACEAEIKLTPIDGDILVEVVKKSKRP